MLVSFWNSLCEVTIFLLNSYVKYSGLQKLVFLSFQNCLTFKRKICWTNFKPTILGLSSITLPLGVTRGHLGPKWKISFWIGHQSIIFHSKPIPSVDSINSFQSCFPNPVTTKQTYLKSDSPPIVLQQKIERALGSHVQHAWTQWSFGFYLNNRSDYAISLKA